MTQSQVQKVAQVALSEYATPYETGSCSGHYRPHHSYGQIVSAVSSRPCSAARSLVQRAGPRVSPRARTAAFPNLSFVTTKPVDRTLTT
jgi:hypothetical protein